MPGDAGEFQQVNGRQKKYVQTLDGPLFVAGKSNRCLNPACPHPLATYYASGVLSISLPYSTSGSAAFRGACNPLRVNQSLADDVRAAHTQLRRIADCLHYGADEGAKTPSPGTGQAVRDAMDSLLAEFRPDPRYQPAQAALQCVWHRV
jgi:hypothetical protein